MRTSPESGLPQPKEIRAHHLVFVRDLQRGKTPAQIADGWEKKVTSLRYRLFIAPPDYYPDTYGKTPEERAAFRNGIFDLMTEIQDLEPDQPVKIITEKDKICAGCTLGNHCNRGDYQINERGYMKVFRRVAQRRGLEGELDVEIDRTGSITSITAPASVVKNIATVFSFPKSAIAERREILHERRIRRNFK
jgi:hypothetical protein